MSPRRLAAALAFTAALLPAVGHAFETNAREALVIDDGTGMVLFAKDADTRIPPASMSKLMTLYMLFEALRDGRVTMETTFGVSPHAQSMPGSRMFVEAGTEVPVEALIQGIVVQSGNDACVVVAEGLAGTETEFAKQMTRRAQELGMAASTACGSVVSPGPCACSTTKSNATSAKSAKPTTGSQTEDSPASSTISGSCGGVVDSDMFRFLTRF